MSETQLADRIVSAPGVCGGRPRIAGTRVRVIDIIEALAAGDTADEIVESLPYVNHEDIRAALSYAASVLERNEDLAA